MVKRVKPVEYYKGQLLWYNKVLFPKDPKVSRALILDGKRYRGNKWDVVNLGSFLYGEITSINGDLVNVSNDGCVRTVRKEWLVEKRFV
jgi:hypothetical protein